MVDLTKFKRLSDEEQALLKEVLSVHGNLEVVRNKTKLNVNTIKRCSEGLRVEPTSYKRVVKFLKGLQVTQNY